MDFLCNLSGPEMVTLANAISLILTSGLTKKETEDLALLIKLVHDDLKIIALKAILDDKI